MTKKKTSEFGKGFIYNLVLFAKHWAMWNAGTGRMNPPMDYSMWFSGAGDHLFEMEVPKEWEKTAIGKRAKDLRSRALYFRINSCSESQFKQFFTDLQALCRLIDKKLGVESIEADWS